MRSADARLVADPQRQGLEALEQHPGVERADSAGPVWRMSVCTGPSMYSSVPRIAPPSTRPWPSMCLVAE